MPCFWDEMTKIPCDSRPRIFSLYMVGFTIKELSQHYKVSQRIIRFIIDDEDKLCQLEKQRMEENKIIFGLK